MAFCIAVIIRSTEVFTKMRCLQIKIYPLNHTEAETQNEFSTLISPVAWTAEYKNGAGTIKLLYQNLVSV